MNKFYKYEAITRYDGESGLRCAHGLKHVRVMSPSQQLTAISSDTLDSANKIRHSARKPIYSECPLLTTYYFNDSLRLPEKDVVIADILEVLQDAIADKTGRYRISGKWRREPADN